MLKDHIKSSGKSQRIWARLLGIAESHLSALMNGKKVPSLELAVRIQRLTNGVVQAESWVQPEAQDSTPAEDAA